MRTLTLLLLVLGAVLVMLHLTSGTCVAQEPWYIDQLVVLGEVDLEANSTIVVRSNGTLELRGTALAFNNSYGLKNGIAVIEGGSLIIAPSNLSKPTTISSTEPTLPAYINVMGGQLVRVEGLIMTGGDPAISLRFTMGARLRSCTFIDCLRAVEVSDCRDIVVEGNQFVNATYKTLNMRYIWNLEVANNSITRSQRGLELSLVSGGRVIGNTIGTTGTCVSLYYAEDVTVSGSTFATTKVGCLVSFSSRVTIEDCSFIPVSPDARGDGLVIDLSAFTTVRGCRFERLERAVRMTGWDSFSPAFTLVRQCTILDCPTGISISASNNTLSNITVTNATIGIAMVNRSGGGTMDIVEGNRVQGCLVRNCTTGILVMGADATLLAENGYVDCDRDVTIEGRVRLRSANESHESSRTCAMCNSGSYLEVTDGAFEGASPALTSDSGAVSWVRQSRMSVAGQCVIGASGSTTNLVNTTHHGGYDLDASSIVRVFWDVRVTILFSSGRDLGQPAELRVDNHRTVRVAEMHILVPSRRLKLEVLSLEAEGEGRESMTPHRFSVASSGREASAVALVDSCTNVSILLDDTPPSIRITSPNYDAVNNGSVRFAGFAIDDSGPPVRLLIQLDGAAIFDGEDGWDLYMTVEDGLHSVYYRAEDVHDNSAEQNWTLLIDTLPPSLVIEHPSVKRVITPVAFLVLDGRVTDGDRLTVNGNQVPLHQGRFSTTLPLPEDGRYEFLVRAYDAHCNSAEERISVTRDTAPPTITLDRWNPLTREAACLIEGWTSETPVDLTIGGLHIGVDATGRFSYLVDLAEGRNDIIVESRDPAGNTARVSINITRDSKMLLKVVSPVNGTVVQVADIEMIVRAEPGSSVRIAGEGWTKVGDAGFCRLNATLSNGTTTIIVEGRDELGNNATDLIVVYLQSPRVEETDLHTLSWIVGVTLLAAISFSFVLFRREPPNDV